jgi:hypothetical protein
VLASIPKHESKNGLGTDASFMRSVLWRIALSFKGILILFRGFAWIQILLNTRLQQANARRAGARGLEQGNGNQRFCRPEVRTGRFLNRPFAENLGLTSSPEVS